jgi:hypothetical protein
MTRGHEWRGVARLPVNTVCARAGETDNPGNGLTAPLRATRQPPTAQTGTRATPRHSATRKRTIFATRGTRTEHHTAAAAAT